MKAITFYNLLREELSGTLELSEEPDLQSLNLLLAFINELSEEAPEVHEVHELPPAPDTGPSPVRPLFGSRTSVTAPLSAEARAANFATQVEASGIEGFVTGDAILDSLTPSSEKKKLQKLGQVLGLLDTRPALNALHPPPFEGKLQLLSVDSTVTADAIRIITQRIRALGTNGSAAAIDSYAFWKELVRVDMPSSKDSFYHMSVSILSPQTKRYVPVALLRARTDTLQIAGKAVFLPMVTLRGFGPNGTVVSMDTTCTPYGVDKDEHLPVYLQQATPGSYSSASIALFNGLLLVLDSITDEMEL
jgi:hypothetical protein